MINTVVDNNMNIQYKQIAGHKLILKHIIHIFSCLIIMCPYILSMNRVEYHLKLILSNHVKSDMASPINIDF